DLAGAGTRRVEILRNRPSAPSRLPEPLRWDAKRPVETRGCVLPGDDHRQLRDGVVVVVPLHAREQLVVDVAARVRDRVGVFERDLLRVGEKRALRVVVEQHLELLRRDTVPAADGSIRVLSELATVPPGDATIEQRPERNRHALRLLLERGPHRPRRAEVRRVAGVEEIRIERRAIELALFLERSAQVVRERFDVDGRDACFPFQHGHLLMATIVTLRNGLTRGEYFDGDRSVNEYRLARTRRCRRSGGIPAVPTG